MIFKSHNRCSGDSLPEALAASVIIALSLIAILSVSQVAYKSMAQAKSRYSEYYELLNEKEEAETKTTVATVIATFGMTSYNDYHSAYSYTLVVRSGENNNKKLYSSSVNFINMYDSNGNYKYTYLQSVRWWW